MVSKFILLLASYENKLILCCNLLKFEVETPGCRLLGTVNVTIGELGLV